MPQREIIGRKRDPAWESVIIGSYSEAYIRQLSIITCVKFHGAATKQPTHKSPIYGKLLVFFTKLYI